MSHGGSPKVQVIGAHARAGAEFSTIPGALASCFGVAEVQDQDRDSQREQGNMRDRKAAEADTDVEARVAQIEQMTLDQIAAFQGRMLTDITKGRIAPREASVIDRALRKRLKAIEQELRERG